MERVLHWNTCHNSDYAHLSQHWPLVVVALVSVPAHIVGKHHTSLQIALTFPPWLPVAPLTTVRSMFGFTQYGQQWPATSFLLKPAGHERAPHVIPPQGSFTGPRPFCRALKSLSALTDCSALTSFCSWLKKTIVDLYVLLSFACNLVSDGIWR